MSNQRVDPAFVDRIVRATMWLIVTLLAILALGLITILLGWLVQIFWV